jgi:hypothetical protein
MWKAWPCMSFLHDSSFTSVRRFVPTPEAERIEAAVGDLLERPASAVLYSLVGVPGSGKSATLEQLRGLSRPALLVLALPLRRPGGPARTPEALDHSAIVATLLAQASGAVSLADLPEPVPQDFSSEESAGALKRLAEALVADSARRVLLLVDDCDVAPRALMDWLEQNLLRTLLRSGQVVSVLTFQDSYRFTEFDLRRRAQLVRLHPLNLARTALQLGLPANGELAAELFKLTLGLPLANEVAFAALQRDELRAPLDDATRGALLSAIVEQILERLVVQATPHLRALLRIAALLRDFDEETLRELAGARGAGGADGYELDRRHDLDQQLNATRLVRWEDENRASAIEKTVRTLLAEELRLNHNEQFRAIHGAAAAYYERLLTKAPLGRNQFLIEHLYHSLYNASLGDYNEGVLRKTVTDLIFAHYYSRSKAFVETGLLDQLDLLLSDDGELHQALAFHGFAPDILQTILAETRRLYPGDGRARPRTGT